MERFPAHLRLASWRLVPRETVTHSDYVACYWPGFWAVLLVSLFIFFSFALELTLTVAVFHSGSSGMHPDVTRVLCPPAWGGEPGMGGLLASGCNIFYPFLSGSAMDCR